MVKVPPFVCLFVCFGKISIKFFLDTILLQIRAYYFSPFSIFYVYVSEEMVKNLQKKRIKYENIYSKLLKMFHFFLYPNFLKKDISSIDSSIDEAPSSIPGIKWE